MINIIEYFEFLLHRKPNQRANERVGQNSTKSEVQPTKIIHFDMKTFCNIFEISNDRTLQIVPSQGLVHQQ